LKIIKLNAIDSTNSFLKDLVRNSVVNNFTVVTADEQTAGKGQLGNKWLSEKGKNLTISIFIKYTNALITNQNYLNFAICLAVFDTISEYNVPNLTIKWPNDIMSANKKISGILIENTLKKDKIISSIIGIGINVNQTEFQSQLSKATSIQNCINQKTDLNLLTKKVQKKVICYMESFQKGAFLILEDNYLSKLYKKGIPSTFIDSHKNYFMGIINGVSKNGKLQVLLGDDSIKEFGIKEITFT